jgi:outer membrane lipoprotein SlyB
MSMHNGLFLGLFALLGLLPLTLAPGAVLAQQYTSPVASPRIGGFDVEQVRQLVAGTELNFTLYGTPGGIAIISIPGATGRLLLEEVETGLYVGTYTIKTRDQIVPDSRITANLRLGNLVSSVVLDESLIASAPMTPARRMADAASSNADPIIDRFDVVPNQLVAGSALVFTLYGSPGGRASVRIAGVTGRVFLDETRDGVYEGTYIIKTRDQVLPDSRVTANLRLGDRRSSAVLGKSLLAASGVQPGARRVARHYCANCGVVEAINVIEVKGEGSYLGMIAGGLAGALLGSQVGGGSGRTVATVAGAAGGAYAGNEIEKRMKTTARHYEVIVRLEGGGSQAVSYEAEPAFRVGDRVKVENSTLVRDQ